MTEETDYTRGAKKSLIYELDQKVIMVMTPIVDGVRQEPVTYDNWDAGVASAEGGAARAKEANPNLETGANILRNYCIESKLKRARDGRSEEQEKSRIAKKHGAIAQENVVRYRNIATNVQRQAREEVRNVRKDQAGRKNADRG